MSLRRWQGPGASAGWLAAGLLLLLQLSGSVRASEITFELPDNAKQCFYEEIVQGTKCTLEFQVRRSPFFSRRHIGKDNPPYTFARFQLVGQKMGLEAAPLIVCVSKQDRKGGGRRGLSGNSSRKYCKDPLKDCECHVQTWPH